MTRRAARIAVVAVLWLLTIASLVTTGAARATGAPGATIGAARASGPSAVGLSTPPPRLVVVISIDQFRADYLTRFADLWLPAVGVAGAPGQEKPGKVGGFRYLMERGAYFTDARHDHYPLFTGPGHAVLLTGAPPYKSGIVGNSWFDRELGRRRYCVEDDAKPFGGHCVPTPSQVSATSQAPLAERQTAPFGTTVLGTNGPSSRVHSGISSA